MQQHRASAVSTRRGFLGMVSAGALTTVATVGVAGSASAAALAQVARPEVARRWYLPRTLAWPGGHGLVRPGFAVDYVGVRLSAAGGGGRIRFSDRTGGLGP